MIGRPVKILTLLLFSCCAHLSHAQEAFDAAGYYFPENEVVTSGYRLKWVEILATPNSVDDQASHPDYSVAARSSIASVVLERIKDQHVSLHRIAGPTVAKDNVQLSTSNTPIGVITIKGTFLDKRGQFWNQPGVKALVTPVLEGKLKIVRDGKVVYSHACRFTYWQGD